jgi:hypothetical protein
MEIKQIIGFVILLNMCIELSPADSLRDQRPVLPVAMRFNQAASLLRSACSLYHSGKQENAYLYPAFAICSSITGIAEV